MRGRGAVANRFSNDVSVLLGNGDGTFGGATNYGAGSGPSSVAVDDLDGDSKADLVVANFNSGNVSVLLNETNDAPTLAVASGGERLSSTRG